MSPRPPSTAPSIRWPGPPNNDTRFGGGPPPRSGWGVPNQFWATVAATQSLPLGVAGTATGRWRAPGRTAMPDGTASGGHGSIRRTSTREGRSLRERWEMWDLLALGAPPWSWPRSAIDADRVDQMCAQSAAQSARRSVNWPAAHRIPMARRWLICTLYAACVRWSAARARCHGHPVTEPWSPGRMVAFGSPWLSLCTTVKRPPPRRECARRRPSSHPPPNREDETMQDTVDQAHSAMPRHPRRHQRGCTRGRVWPRLGRTAEHGRARSLKPREAGARRGAGADSPGRGLALVSGGVAGRSGALFGCRRGGCRGWR